MGHQSISYLKINGEEIKKCDLSFVIAAIQKDIIGHYNMIYFVLNDKYEISIHGNSNFGFGLSVKNTGKIYVSNSMNLSLQYIIKSITGFMNSNEIRIDQNIFKEVNELPAKFYQSRTYNIAWRNYILLPFIPFVLSLLWSIPFVASSLLISFCLILLKLDNLIHFKIVANSQQFYFVALGIVVFIYGLLDIIVKAIIT